MARRPVLFEKLVSGPDKRGYGKFRGQLLVSWLNGSCPERCVMKFDKSGALAKRPQKPQVGPHRCSSSEPASAGGTETPYPNHNPLCPPPFALRSRSCNQAIVRLGICVSGLSALATQAANHAFDKFPERCGLLFGNSNSFESVHY